MRAWGWFLLLIAAALAAIAAFTYPVWLALHPRFDFPFHRVADRIGMLTLFAGFVLIARRLGLDDRGSLGYALPLRDFVREMVLGLALGLVTLAPAVANMWALGLLSVSPGRVLGAGLLGKSLLSGLAVGFVEETFMRGAMLTAIQRESGARAAIAITAIIYSASHFVASVHIPPESVSSGSGLALLAGALHAFAHPLSVADAFLSLAAIGGVLGAVRVITGNIAACIGLHAGWVWMMLTVHELTQPARTAPLSFLLSRHDGFTGWLVLGWTAVIGAALWKFYRKRYRSSASAR